MATANERDRRAAAAPARPGSTAGTGASLGSRSALGADSAGTCASVSSAAAGGSAATPDVRGGDGFADTAPSAADAVKERASALWDDAKEAARSKLSEQKAVAADGLGDVAGALREAAERQRGDASRRPIAQLTGSAAEGLERLSSTLRSKDVSSMARDVESFARDQPIAFFGLAVAAGFVAVRFLKASND